MSSLDEAHGELPVRTAGAYATGGFIGSAMMRGVPLWRTGNVYEKGGTRLSVQNTRGGCARSWRSGRLTSARMCATSEHGVESSPGRKGIRPKQSLGQNFLRDSNVAERIVRSFCDAHGGRGGRSRVVEVGPGLGALTGLLAAEFPDLVAIEIDRRAISVLRETYKNVDVRHGDVLETDWGRLSRELGGDNEDEATPISVIGNMPYNIVSQILFSLLDAPRGSIDMVYMMMQKEVAERLTARTRSKSYGILSVVTQLYGEASILFTVGGKSFYPEPDVTSCMVRLDLDGSAKVDTHNETLVRGLKQVIKAGFGQRRKVLRNCLRTVCERQGVQVPDQWSAKRAEELAPEEFVQLTQVLFHHDLAQRQQDGPSTNGPGGGGMGDCKDAGEMSGVWRSHVRNEKGLHKVDKMKE